jgi:nucleoid-associated protein YgaU
VQRGDTLSILSRQYYGTSAKWRDIYNANRDILKSENETLRIGMELRIT